MDYVTATKFKGNGQQLSFREVVVADRRTLRARYQRNHAKHLATIVVAIIRALVNIGSELTAGATGPLKEPGVASEHQEDDESQPSRFVLSSRAQGVDDAQEGSCNAG
jgi:hypothetical protein